MADPLVVLGVDPGLASLGWAALHVDGRKRSLYDCGTVHTSADLDDDERVRIISGELRRILTNTCPDAVAVEAHVWQGPKRSANPEAFRISRVSGLVEGFASAWIGSQSVQRITRQQALRAVGCRCETAANITIARLLKFPGRSSQHARDAAMLAWAGAQRGRAS